MRDGVTPPAPSDRGGREEDIAARPPRDASLGDDGQDVARGEDEILLTLVLDLGAAVLGVDDHVALGDVDRDALAGVVHATGAHGQDLALLRLLLGGVRNDQAGGGGLLGLERLDDDAVLERLEYTKVMLYAGIMIVSGLILLMTYSSLSWYWLFSPPRL